MKTKSLLYAVSLLILSSCALFGGDKEPEKPVASPVAKAEVKKPEVKPTSLASRELGAIWSESSKWNETFADGSTRNIGDVVFVKPNDQFKALLSGKPDRITQSASDYVNAAARESNQIVVRIKEILPQGIYMVEGDQHIKVRGRVQVISLSGKIRERDIAADDTAASDAIFDMNLEVNGSDPSDPDHLVASNDAVSGKDKDKNKNKSKSKTKDSDNSKDKESDKADNASSSDK